MAEQKFIIRGLSFTVSHFTFQYGRTKIESNARKILIMNVYIPIWQNKNQALTPSFLLLRSRFTFQYGRTKILKTPPFVYAQMGLHSNMAEQKSPPRPPFSPGFPAFTFQYGRTKICDYSKTTSKYLYLYIPIWQNKNADINSDDMDDYILYIPIWQNKNRHDLYGIESQAMYFTFQYGRTKMSSIFFQRR